MVRGIERSLIFRDERDCEELLRRLDLLLLELGFLCFGWVLMPNHLHLLLRSAAARISHLMARLGTGYARYFNERHGRVGHLFQNRFLSRRVVDDADLIGLVLYVSRNPLKAGLVTSPSALELYPWCGLGGLLGRRAPRGFESIGESLCLFDPDPGCARQRIRAWLDVAPEQDGVVEPAPAEVRCTSPASARGLDALADEVCRAFGVTSAELCSRSRGRTLVEARSELARRAVRQLGSSGAEIARVLGVSRAAVSLMLARSRSARPTT
jgi:REP element-mobilizing transposase RayT